ncbi:MAG TPA: protocatechuate 3,4-dioxygenase subunit alpha [Streptosporangiaceae bacterium]|jgi:protocatechuate 3,4-dioxygenase alpha subunit
MTGQTPSQTIGPFFIFALPFDSGPYVVPDGTPGAIRIAGRVFDGAGEPVSDALIETWQADTEGRYATSGDFRGYGRCPTDDDGGFHFLTVKPGPVAGRAPHIDVIIFARGLLLNLVTRIYFPDEEEANAADPALTAVDPERRGTLIAHKDGDDTLRFDIRLQGENETVFFDV